MSLFAPAPAPAAVATKSFGSLTQQEAIDLAKKLLIERETELQKKLSAADRAQAAAAVAAAHIIYVEAKTDPMVDEFEKTHYLVAVSNGNIVTAIILKEKAGTVFFKPKYTKGELLARIKATADKLIHDLQLVEADRAALGGSPLGIFATPSSIVSLFAPAAPAPSSTTSLFAPAASATTTTTTPSPTSSFFAPAAATTAAPSPMSSFFGPAASAVAAAPSAVASFFTPAPTAQVFAPGDAFDQANKAIAVDCTNPQKPDGAVKDFRAGKFSEAQAKYLAAFKKVLDAIGQYPTDKFLPAAEKIVNAFFLGNAEHLQKHISLQFKNSLINAAAQARAPASSDLQKKTHWNATLRAITDYTAKQSVETQCWIMYWVLRTIVKG